MKIFSRLAIAILIVVAMTTACYAGWVNGYTKSNGTYVDGYYRSDANSTVTDNYSFKGNVNPYTGETGSDYYRSSPSSPYYNGGSNSGFGSGSLGGGSLNNYGSGLGGY